MLVVDGRIAPLADVDVCVKTKAPDAQIPAKPTFDLVRRTP
jgi:hypothetical protein